MFVRNAALVTSYFCSLGVLAQITLETTPPQQLTAPLVASKLSNTAAKLASSRAPTYPQWTYLSGNGSWQYFPAGTWTSGFFPASLYLMNTRKSVLCKADNTTGQTDWLASAESWMQGLDPVANPNANLFGVRHDVGFLSFGWFEALTLNANNEKAKAAINSYATFLASRYNPVVGCTMSWNPSTADPTEFKVIIDNMMNLELLIISSKLTGNTTLYDIATSHANKTMVNHLRPDASSYHVVNYNPDTGAVVWQRTAQGYADNSTWTRGQAWGIHGFATMYNYTNDVNYWITSRRLAEYYLSRLPSTGIPPWDFDAPDVAGRPSDTSSAMIAASGMLMLSRFEQGVSNTTGANYWANAAVRLLSSSVSLAWREESNWDSLLSNGTVNNPGKPPNNNTGIIYGDYYFIKAGNELLSQGLVNCSNGQVPTANAPTTIPSSSQSGGAVFRSDLALIWPSLLMSALLAHLIGYM